MPTVVLAQAVEMKTGVGRVFAQGVSTVRSIWLAFCIVILATGAVHSHLMTTGLRTYTSLNVRSGECLDTQFFAVLVGVGATTVNAYLAEENIIDIHFFY